MNNHTSIRRLTLASLSLAAATHGETFAAGHGDNDRPNILWLSFEDTSFYEFGCYGNRHVSTPVIDSLARGGFQFMNAYSIGPQSSPARSCIITGCYSTTFAMDWHRRRVPTPQGILFPEYLRKAGYFCTNKSKTDYNTTLDNKSCWDVCGGEKATYNNPDRGNHPFFAVFNCNITHMSRLTSVHLDGRRDFSKEGIDPASLDLPPHVPDIDAVRSDYAFHLEGANDIDKWVALFLEDLNKQGLADNTIIFVFSDHGGCLPRGKAFSYESSYRVPMIVHLPDKWKHLTKMTAGNPVDRFVDFADLAPTVLSVAGIRPPEYMQGIAFLGDYDGARKQYQYGLVCNRETHYVPSRTISDGRWKYIRNYIPYKRDALYNSFQWQMPSNLYWDKHYFENTGMTDLWRKPYEVYDAEALYDLANDPFELVNLASVPENAAKLGELRGKLAEHIRQTRDLGFFTAATRMGSLPLYDKVRQPGYDLEALYRLAELTATVTGRDIPALTDAAKKGANEIKFWAAVNFGVLARSGHLADPPAELVALLENDDPQVASEAAYALCYSGRRELGFDYILAKKEMEVLEVISLDKGMKETIPQQVIALIEGLSQSYENLSKGDKKATMLGARKVMVNLGMLPAEQLYGAQAYQAGLKTNRERRPLEPVPYYGKRADQKE